MSEPTSPDLRHVIIDKLTASLSVPLPLSTPRKVFGDVEFPGKATAVVGMRRSGKTTYLHQRRKGRVESGAPRNAVPYINLRTSASAI